MKRTIVALLAGLLIGVAAGFGSSMFLADPGGEPPAASAITTDALPDVRIAPVATPGRSAALDAAADPRPQPSAAALAQALEVAAGVARQTAAEGTLAIEGRICDEEGRPVAGVRVRAEPIERSLPQRSERAAAAARTETLEDVVRRAVESYYRTEVAAREALSGADGRYRIEGLADMQYEVKAYKDGHEVAPLGHNQRVRAPGSADFRATPVSACTFDVRLPDGTPAAKALISWQRRTDGRNANELWEAREPVLKLMPGSYRASANIRGDLKDELALPHELQSEPVDFEVAPGTAGEPVKLTLNGKPAIRGRVTLPHPSLARTAQVRFARQEDNEAIDGDFLRDFGGSTSVQGGRYEIRDLRPGTYYLATAPHPELPLGRIERVELGAADVTLDLELAPIAAEDCLVIHARDGSDRPVLSLGFHYEIKLGDEEDSSSLGTIERGGGEHWVVPDTMLRKHMEGRSSAGARCRVFLNAGNHGQQTIDLEPMRRRIDVVFRSGSSVRVTVPAYAGGPYEGRLQVSLERRPEEPQNDEHFEWVERERLGEDGSVLLGPTGTGEHRLRLWLSVRVQGSGQDELVVGSTRLQLREGENAATLSLDPLHELLVRLESDAEGYLTVQNEADNVHFWARIREGKVLLRDLPAGEYLLEHYHRDKQRQMRVRVPEQREVTFQAEAASALRVHVWNNAGPLYKMGLRDGDVIVALQGRRFDHAERLRAEMITATPPAAVSVVRDGGVVEVPIDPAQLATDDLGGWLEPVPDPRG